MRKRAGPSLVLVLAMAALAAGASPPRDDAQVMIGGTEDLNACPSNGQVSGLSPRGDNFLTVRSQPSAAGRELDRLAPDQVVWACDETYDGEWTGIVYSPPGKDLDCGVGSPVKRRAAYRGPCRLGWVASHYLTIIAG